MQDRFFARVHARERARIRTRALNFLARTYAHPHPRTSGPRCYVRAAHTYVHTCRHTCARTCTNARTRAAHTYTRARFTRAIALSPRRISPNPGFLSRSLSRSPSSLPTILHPPDKRPRSPPLSPATLSLTRARPSHRLVSLPPRNRPLSTRTVPLASSASSPHPPVRPVSSPLPSPTFTAVLHLT
ncbi:hypothetical protein PUN28_005811 [Cardiocondyla obscurior]|uniref:Uncharacterized protein n=1 Tax=Cardiocondyla obscurior TaxID=286306 RepID=A0AAW2G698_9HYME